MPTISDIQNAFPPLSSEEQKQLLNDFSMSIQDLLKTMVPRFDLKLSTLFHDQFKGLSQQAFKSFTQPLGQLAKLNASSIPPGCSFMPASTPKHIHIVYVYIDEPPGLN